MSYRNPKQQDGKVPLDGRSGLGGFPPLRGVKKSRNPASLADNQFDNLLNVRLRRGILRERGGLVKGATNAFPGVQGVHDATDIGDPGAGVADFLTPLTTAIYQISNDAVSGDWFSYNVDALATTRVALPSPFPRSTFARPFAAMEKLVIGTRVTAINTNLNLYQWTLADGVTLAHAITVNFANSSWRGRAFSCGVEFGTNFYLSVWYQESGLDPHHLLIYRWDGTNAPVLELDQQFSNPNVYDTPGTYNTWALYSDGVDVFAINKAAEGAETAGPTPANLIKRRNGGAWTTISMPVGYNWFGASWFEAGISYGAVVRYAGNTYIAGHDQNAVSSGATVKKLKILKWDGASLTEVWTRTNSTMNGGINLFVADGILYYNYNDSTAVVHKTGSFNGTTWNDNVKDWTSAPQSVNKIPHNVVDYAGELWCGGLGANVLHKTTSRNVAGTWSPTTSDADNGNYLDLYTG